MSFETIGRARFLLDLSRLLWASERDTPGGIDRVELAYAQALIAAVPERLGFCAWRRDTVAPLPFDAACRLVEDLAGLWMAGERQRRPRVAASARRLRRALALARFLGLGALGRDPLAGGSRSDAPLFYLSLAHTKLDREAAIRALKLRLGAKFVAFVHDLIPIAYPEFSRPGLAERHRARMTTVARHADAIVFNSCHTEAEFVPFLDPAGRRPATAVAPLGIALGSGQRQPDAAEVARNALSDPPYFVTVGTIDPRKNHLLLLNIWRKLALRLGTRTPHLHLVGRRGWEDENIVDMLERCVPIQGIVHELAGGSDRAIEALLAGASAVLQPSFAEGYGIPVVESLALGAPVVCSDIPAHREIGGGVPEYLDPLDGLGWERAILDYAAPDSQRRAAQRTRLRGWSPPRWDDHFAKVAALLNAVVERDP